LRGGQPYGFFNKLFYAFNKPTAVAGVPLETMLNGKIGKKYLTRDVSLDLFEPVMSVLTAPPTVSTIIDTVDITDVAIILYTDYLRYLRIMQEHIKIYTVDQKVFESHKNLWATYRLMKSAGEPSLLLEQTTEHDK